MLCYDCDLASKIVLVFSVRRLTLEKTNSFWKGQEMTTHRFFEYHVVPQVQLWHAKTHQLCPLIITKV